MIKRTSLILLGVSLLGAVATGCTSEVGELLECAQVCESYDDCVMDSYDQTACTDACEDYADVSNANEEQVFACDDCLNDMECSDACNAECAGIIPAF